MSLKKLTDYETGESVYVDRSRIVSMRRLPAKVLTDVGDIPIEMTARTRIDTGTDSFLVRETPEEVLAGEIDGLMWPSILPPGHRGGDS